MRVTSWRPAAEHERFAPHAFDSLIGQTVPWNFRETEDGPVIRVLGTATVIDVKVADDGSGAHWTVEYEGGQEDG